MPEAFGLLHEPSCRVENDGLYISNEDGMLVLLYDEVVSVRASNRKARPKEREGQYL